MTGGVYRAERRVPSYGKQRHPASSIRFRFLDAGLLNDTNLPWHWKLPVTRCVAGAAPFCPNRASSSPFLSPLKEVSNVRHSFMTGLEYGSGLRLICEDNSNISPI